MTINQCHSFRNSEQERLVENLQSNSFPIDFIAISCYGKNENIQFKKTKKQNKTKKHQKTNNWRIE